MSCADRAAKDGIADITKKCDAVSVAFAGEKVSRVRCAEAILKAY